MLSAFELQDQRLCQIDSTEVIRRLNEAVWVDLVDTTEEERQLVESMYRQQLPDPEEVEEIEATARFFEDESGLHIHSLFLHELQARPHTSTVAFTLNPGRLVTLHDHDIPVFRLLRLRARREVGLVSDPLSILLALFETKVEDLADTLEQVYTGLEEVSRRVLEDNDSNMEGIIDELAGHEDTNGKVRLCLMDTQRALSYLLRKGRLTAGHADQVREIMRDVESLLPHSAFLFEKVNFLMDATQNFINIEQNQIIKIFSIAAVVFLPPTLIASMYGMNFRYMPELDWYFGYPMAIVLMILSGLAPYWYFKRKGWL